MIHFTDEIHLAGEKSKTDAEFYQMKLKAAANEILLTKQYLELKKYEALAVNNKVYFGADIPNMFLLGADETLQKKSASEKGVWCVIAGKTEGPIADV